MTSLADVQFVRVDVVQRANTSEGVMAHFAGRFADAFAWADAWSWWRELAYQDYLEDRQTWEREGAKVALSCVLTQIALAMLASIR